LRTIHTNYLTKQIKIIIILLLLLPNSILQKDLINPKLILGENAVLIRADTGTKGDILRRLKTLEEHLVAETSESPVEPLD
jgi:hypothetical protein